MDVLADGVAFGHRGDHRVAEVLRVRAREADALDPVDGVARAQQLAELGVEISGARSRPQELTFWPSSVISLTPSAASRVTSATMSPGRRLCSRPRTAGTMQYEHVELQPIDTCTHALNGALAVLRQVAGEMLVRAEPARARRRRPRPDPLAEVRDRAGPERDVDLRIELEDPLLLRLGVAAADGDHEVGVLALPRSGVAEVGGELRVGLLADRARVEDDDVGLVLRGRLAEPERLEHALDPLGVVSVHLAAERGDVVPLHRAAESSPARSDEPIVNSGLAGGVSRLWILASALRHQDGRPRRPAPRRSPAG